MRRRITSCLIGLFLMIGATSSLNAQHSVARTWNEVLLECIRNDFARPTVHARNLHHVSIAMYDAWASYTSAASNYFLGDTIGSFVVPFAGVLSPSNVKQAQEEALSYAVYRILRHRFDGSPGASYSLGLADSVFMSLGYDSSYHSANYLTGTPADLGNYLAQRIIQFGLQDGSNELIKYDNVYYSPKNSSLIPIVSGNPGISDPNRWQPLTLSVFIDQSGNVIPLNTPEFLSPEWGNVVPFALQDSNMTIHTRSNGDKYRVYHDPGPPPYLDTINGNCIADPYKWGFSLVSVWSGQLDPADSVMWDISPASIGNIQNYPTSFDSFPGFYDLLNGGDISIGHTLNPVTNQPYAPQMVPRADYGRVLAEFWADGPDSETPPGHWFTILNYVHDHPAFERKWGGQGPEVPELEWDVKAYFTLSGAMHDAAITAWGIKGWYDYLRPISAIRYMADQGQCSDTSLSNYSDRGIPLIPGYIEVVDSMDPLVGANYANLNKIKLFAWKGPDSISNPLNDYAGVGWILAENWWPYQRPTFVTPPFAGYVSGHSTYSRAAAEVLTYMTGDPFFPGGMGEFVAPKDQFLVFEDGPSVDVTLQWATYRDASDQCSLSRIWGGIHPPADDMPGRLAGEILGVDAFDLAETYFVNNLADINCVLIDPLVIADTHAGQNFTITAYYDMEMDTTMNPTLSFPVENPSNTIFYDPLSSGWLNTNAYRWVFLIVDANETLPDIDIQISGAIDLNANMQVQYDGLDHFDIDMVEPMVVSITPSTGLIMFADTGIATFALDIAFNE